MVVGQAISHFAFSAKTGGRAYGREDFPQVISAIFFVSVRLLDPVWLMKFGLTHGNGWLRTGVLQVGDMSANLVRRRGNAGEECRTGRSERACGLFGDDGDAPTPRLPTSLARRNIRGYLR